MHYELQQQNAALQAVRQAQLARDEAKAAEEAATCHRAAQSGQGLIWLNIGGVGVHNKPDRPHSDAKQLLLSSAWLRMGVAQDAWWGSISHGAR